MIYHGNVQIEMMQCREELFGAAEGEETLSLLRSFFLEEKNAFVGALFVLAA